MAITTTRDFNLDIGDILEEAYEQAGMPGTRGQDFRSALRSLNLIQLEWSNLGINLWQVEEVGWNASGVVSSATDYLIADQATYNLAFDTMSLCGALIRINPGEDNQVDYFMNPMPRADYQTISNKRTTGRPTLYYFNRVDIKDESPLNADKRSTLTLWPTPDVNSTYQLIYWRMKRMVDAGDGPDSNVPIPDRFLPAYISSLAAKLAAKSKDDSVRARTQELDMVASRLLSKAMEEDTEKYTVRIVPKMYRV